MIIIVRVRHDGIEAVVAAGHLEHHQDSGIVAGYDLGSLVGCFGLQSGKCVGQEGWDGPRERATQDGGAEKLAARSEREVVFHTLGQLIFGSAHDEANGIQDMAIVKFGFAIQIFPQGFFLF